MTELGSGDALRLPRARVVPLSAPPSSYTAAVERYLTGAGIAKSSARIYQVVIVSEQSDGRSAWLAVRCPQAEAMVDSRLS
ncbi:hypothetical protein [Streptomyces capoamus]|uniref:hypothetical protein n=1 Tax=Streptomyces capoamus TaxID=68183 RepID=UPI00339AE674